MIFAATAIFFFLLGKMSEGHRWRRNADTYFNLESCGNLYKVSRARPGNVVYGRPCPETSQPF